MKPFTYECPVDGCGWKLTALDHQCQVTSLRIKVVYDENGTPVAHHLDGESERLQGIVRQHLEIHDVFEWADTVLRLQQDLAQQHSGIRPHVYRGKQE